MPDMMHWPTTRLLSTAARLVELSWNEKLHGLGLRFASVIALEAVANTGPINQAKLAAIIRIRPQTLGPILTRLGNRGLIERRSSLMDRRMQTVAITAAGREVLDKARELEHSVLQELDMDSGELREQLTTLVKALGTPTTPVAH